MWWKSCCVIGTVFIWQQCTELHHVGVKVCKLLFSCSALADSTGHVILIWETFESETRMLHPWMPLNGGRMVTSNNSSTVGNLLNGWRREIRSLYDHRVYLKCLHTSHEKQDGLSPKEHHMHGEAWWWWRHVLRMFLFNWDWGFIQVNGTHGSLQISIYLGKNKWIKGLW